MKAGFYPHLAADGMRKNRRLYLPYIFTCTGMVMMYYITMALSLSNTVRQLRGGQTLGIIMGFGSWVIALFACLFLFYTNAFLIRRRKKEFGLYNILGMGKRHIGGILFWETLLVAGISLLVGLALGVLLLKLAELGLVRMMNGSVSYDMTFSLTALLATAGVFAAIHLLLLLNALRQVRFSGALSLLRSENAGEKPPRANWVLGLLGILLLAVAYGMAVSIRDPLQALGIFLIAVLLVILGTYLLMIAGSVLLCRQLQKNTRYYYQPAHFVSVSSMAYRMKRNGAGLASVCILATMVLVMLSSTASMYSGAEEALATRYPRQINLEYVVEDADALSGQNIDGLRSLVNTVLQERGCTPTAVDDYRCVTTYAQLRDTGYVALEPEKGGFQSGLSLCYLRFVPLADYNAAMGTHETLGEGEVLLHAYRKKFTGSVLTFSNGMAFRVAKQVEELPAAGKQYVADMTPTLTLVVSSLEAVQPLTQSLTAYAQEGREFPVFCRWYFSFDTALTATQQETVCEALQGEQLGMEAQRAYRVASSQLESREQNRGDFYSAYGGLFYLGIMLSAVFLFATVLILYYKQISEGYEDQARFEVMQKVGMTKKAIRSSINSQLRTVFFLPLLMAGVHLAFAFPMIRKMLLMFNFNNFWLFTLVTGLCYLLFALLYALIYRVTSNAYYGIVSRAQS